MSNPDHDEGGSAFPVPETEFHAYIPGMTLRDYFAGEALAKTVRDEGLYTPEQLARHCYAIADAMIDARKVFNG